MGDPASCFINRNSKDFDEPSITQVLQARGCKLLSSFDTGLMYLQNQLKALAPGP